MLLSSWLESMGLSPEPIIMIGALVLIVVLVVVHFHRYILLFLAPWLGGLGRSIKARWGKPDAETPR
jgi:undecaprenyl-diphosphatase